MNNTLNNHVEIKAKGKPDFTTLYDHLMQVKLATEKFAEHLGLNILIAGLGAILHDIGKVAQIFQERLNPDYIHTENEEPYRHEIASLFFLSLFFEGEEGCCLADEGVRSVLMPGFWIVHQE